MATTAKPPEIELPAVRDSWNEVNGDTWIVGGKLLITRHSQDPGGRDSWADGEGTFFSVTEQDDISPDPEQKQVAPPFPLVYDVGDAHAVWKIGNAFLKIEKVESPHTTREHITIAAIHNWDLDFAIPYVIYHGEWQERYYLITSQVPGQIIEKAWPLMDEEAREALICRIVDICKKLSTRQASSIGGVDGKRIPDHYLCWSKAKKPDFDPDEMLRGAKKVGMDCSTFVFYHCDMGPSNVLIDIADGSVGVIDWNSAGFVPKEWIRTKFRVSAGHDLDDIDHDDERRYEYRRRVQRKLGEEGFPEVADAWMESRGYND